MQEAYSGQGGRRPGSRWSALAGAFCLLALTTVPPASAAPTPDQWIGLDSGRLGDYKWSVKAKQRPCLLVGTTRQVGPFSYRKSKYRTCARSTSHLATSEPPLIATSVQPTSAANAEMTAVGMIVAPAARRVRITLSDGRKATIPLDTASPSQARAARLRRFRYAAFAVRGWWCPERIVSQDATGRTLWDSGTDGYRCSRGGPPNFSE